VPLSIHISPLAGELGTPDTRRGLDETLNEFSRELSPVPNCTAPSALDVTEEPNAKDPTFPVAVAASPMAQDPELPNAVTAVPWAKHPKDPDAVALLPWAKLPLSPKAVA